MRPKEFSVRYLSDTGIRQAVEQGLLKFDPPLLDSQIQPASVDLLLKSFYETWPLSSALPYYTTIPRAEWAPPDWTIPAYTEVTLAATQSIGWTKPLRFATELRSSLRRLSCYTPSGLTMVLAEDRLHVELRNPGPINIKMAPNDKMAQLLFFYLNEMEVGLHKAGISGFEDVADGFERLESLDHGWAIQTPAEARALVREGYLRITPRPRFERGLLRVHAGKRARVLREGVTVNFSAKQDISAAFEEVKLPYTLRPGEHIVVDTMEELELSPHVGIHFYDRLIGSTRGLSFYPKATVPTQREVTETFADVIVETVLGDDAERRMPPIVAQVMADATLMNTPDGWVDPGYSGAFSRQPKTYYGSGVTLREGDPLGHGVLVFFPNPVGRAYGAKELGSHYQGQKDTQLTQK